MKLAILVSMVFTMSFTAVGGEFEQLICKSKKNYVFNNLTLTAKHAVVSANSATLWSATAVVNNGKDWIGDQYETGKIDYLDSDKDYNPRKYVDYVRLDLSKLTDTKTFGKYRPSDDCTIQVMFPKNAKANFDAPVTVSCDQGGGKLTLSCSANK
jgi:hypothetical protein